MEMIKNKYYYAEFSTSCGGIYEVEYPKDFIDDMARAEEESVKSILWRVSLEGFEMVEEEAEMYMPKIEEVILIEEVFRTVVTHREEIYKSDNYDIYKGR